MKLLMDYDDSFTLAFPNEEVRRSFQRQLFMAAASGAKAEEVNFLLKNCERRCQE